MDTANPKGEDFLNKWSNLLGGDKHYVVGGVVDDVVDQHLINCFPFGYPHKEIDGTKQGFELQMKEALIL